MAPQFGGVGGVWGSWDGSSSAAGTGGDRGSSSSCSAVVRARSIASAKVWVGFILGIVLKLDVLVTLAFLSQRRLFQR